MLAYGGWTGGLDDDFVAEQVNHAQSVYFFTLIVSLPPFDSPGDTIEQTLGRLARACNGGERRHVLADKLFDLPSGIGSNLLATRTRRLSLFQHPFIMKASSANKWILPAMLASLAWAFFFS